MDTVDYCEHRIDLFDFEISFLMFLRLTVCLLLNPCVFNINFILSHLALSRQLVLAPCRLIGRLNHLQSAFILATIDDDQQLLHRCHGSIVRHIVLHLLLIIDNE